MKTADGHRPLALPPALLAELEAAANEEHRPVADVARDLIERGLSERRWQAHVGQELQRAHELGLPEHGQPMTDAYRRTIREKIAAGMASLRAGRGIDGEAFMARLDAELVALEQQGR